MRRNRIIIKGATYYITGNINRDKMELKDNNIKEMLLKVLKDSKKKFNFRLKHFVFVDNHIHLIIKPMKENSISKIMQWFFGVFAIRYNKKMKFRGKVWFDRFKSEIINGLKDFKKKFLLMNSNPERLKIVKKNHIYKYSAIYYLKNNNFTFIEALPSFLFYLIC